MIKPYTSRHALSLAVVALVAACGGGESTPSSAQQFEARLAAQASRPDLRRALGAGGGSIQATAVAITNAQFFEWVHLILPDLFPANPTPLTLNLDGTVWDVRAYNSVGYSSPNYLAVAGGRVYALGPATNNALLQLGDLQAFSGAVCSLVNCGTTGGGGAGTLNGCTMPASQALAAGSRYSASYVSSVLVAPSSTGEFEIEGEVEGSATFAGQSAVKTHSKVRGMQSGVPVDIDSLDYQQVAENDLTRLLGADSSTTFEGYLAETRIVYNPATLNSEFTLALGASLIKSESSTSTMTITGLPFSPPPTSATTTTTYTYQARETISVLGRSWETCLYKEVTDGSPGAVYTWHIVGKGIAAKTESRNSAGTVESRSELRSATINGAPL